MNNRVSLIVACLLISTGIVLGAFGAHALKAVLSPESLVSYETGVRYQMYTGLALLALSNMPHFESLSRWKNGLLLLVIGSLLFSVSIYLLSCKSLFGIESMKWLGPVTPIGGSLMILGWLLLGMVAISHKSKQDN